jgi:hypothetical protein|tara:strand:+ start:193 stop:411 length:219 start_codon:yes stop_codon:yes gene_type:complete
VNAKLKIIIVLAGLALSLIGVVLIYQDFAINQVRILPISLFGLGVISSYKVLVKTNHTSRKFKLKEFEDKED